MPPPSATARRYGRKRTGPSSWLSSGATGGLTSVGTDNAGLDRRDPGTSQRKSSVAAAPPTICAPMNPGASAGRMPAKVSLAARASVTAGLANEVEEVNQ